MDGLSLRRPRRYAIFDRFHYRLDMYATRSMASEQNEIKKQKNMGNYCYFLTIRFIREFRHMAHFQGDGLDWDNCEENPGFLLRFRFARTEKCVKLE